MSKISWRSDYPGAAPGTAHNAAAGIAGGYAATGASPNVSQPLAHAGHTLAFGGAAHHAQRDEALVRRFHDRMRKKSHGLCFSAYTDGQGPGTQLSEAQVYARLRVLAPHTQWVRSFSCTDGNEHIPSLAHDLGMKTLAGAWLGTDDAINEREIEGLIRLARDGHVDLAAVGNEVLLREDMPEQKLLDYIERVRAAVPGIPVGYVDAYYLFELHPRIAQACDVLMTNCYPFWEGCPLDEAIAYMQSMVRRVQAVAQGKPVLVSETGWPDRGSNFHGAVPSESAAMRYFLESTEWAEQAGIAFFYFSAFDEAWKVGAEGDVGAYWGLWDKDAQLKYPLGS